MVSGMLAELVDTVVDVQLADDISFALESRSLSTHSDDWVNSLYT